MSNDNDDLNLSEEDRLPWLEAVEDDDTDNANPLRVLGGVLIALAALGLIVGGIWWMQQRSEGNAATGEVIAAPDSDYKQPTNGNDGMKVGNESDAMLATSQGNEASGKVDTRPDADKTATAANNGQQPGQSSASTGANSGQTVAAISGPGAVQLGAYGSTDKANQQWAAISAKVPELAKLPKSVESVTAGGKTVYRLRVKTADAGQAAALCSKITSAGGSCFPVR